MKKINNVYPIIAIIIGFILSVLYFVLIYQYVEDKIWDTATNLITTTLSIVLGAMVSILIYNSQKKRTDNEKLKELKINLEAELSSISRVFTQSERMNVNNLEFLITFIEPIVIIDCVKSGLFASVPVENLLHVSRKMKFYNIQIQYFLSLLNNSNNPIFMAQLAHCHGNVENTRLAIIEDIKLIQNQLNLKPTGSIKSK